MSKRVKTQYKTNSPVHFGNLKYSVPQGTIINYIQEQDGAWIYISDQKITDLKDFKIALKFGLLDIYEGDKVQKTQQKKPQKKKIQRLPVIKSDQDQMGQTIDISDTKNLYDKKYNSKEQKKEEQEVQNIRGLKVIRDNSSQIVEQTGIKMQVKTISDNNKQMLEQVNGKNLKKISMKKKDAEQKAKKIAQKRKKQSIQNQKNMKKGKKK